MSLDQKLSYVGGTGFAIRAIPELNLPALEMSDGPVGVRSNAGLPSATYPGGIGLAATWDRDLAAKIGASIGRDARARGIHYMLGPGTNIYRSPRNGRNFEYFGEDPFLASEMVVGYVTGMQQQGVSATIKHYLGNNSEFLRHDSNSVIDERALREIYLPAFEAAVKRGHVGAVMDSYNFINGKHATENSYFNTDILRNEWGFEGTLMSDWSATYDTVAAANGGLDLEMPTGKYMNPADLASAIQAGKISEVTIDDKIRHILSTAQMFGWLDREQRDNSIPLMSPGSDAVALQAARESAVLLKNSDSTLPLDKSQIKTILVVGPNAYPGAPVGGGSAGVVPFHNVSLLEGLSSTASGVNVLYDPGLPTLSQLADQTTFTTAAEAGKPGLVHEMFDTKDLSGTPHIYSAQHINSAGMSGRALPENLRDMLNLPVNGSRSYSQRYTGYYRAEKDGSYLVALAGAGEGNGDRVYIDDKLVIDDWDLVRAFEPHLSLALAAGAHKVVVESWGGGPFGGRLRFAIAPEDKVVTERAKQLAARADAVIVAAGFSSNADVNSEGEGGDRTFGLPYGQDALIEAMSAANRKTIVTVTSGGNIDSTRWIGKVPALIEGWYGGQEGGRALAEILFGITDPSGHLPATFEQRPEDNPTFNTYYPESGTNRIVYREGIFVGYRGYEKNNIKPLFPFGFGLSYTSFSCSNLKVAAHNGTSFATVDFDITNSGQRSGADVAQVYVAEPRSKVERPAHELKGFQRVELDPGQTRHLSISLDARAFAYYDVTAKKWSIDPGRFVIQVGDSSTTLPLTQPLTLTAQDVVQSSL
jgi:beta-glucosidase